MAVIIDMEMPKGCALCPQRCTNFNGLSFSERFDIKYENSRLDTCPLQEHTEENKNMSWEELVEKVKELKSDLLIIFEDYICYCTNKEIWGNLEFGIDNQIVFRYFDGQKIIHTDRSFYQMYQIIKSLVGDER